MIFLHPNPFCCCLIEIGQRSKQAIQPWNYRGMCNKPLETKTEPPPPTTPAHGRFRGGKHCFLIMPFVCSTTIRVSNHSGSSFDLVSANFEVTTSITEARWRKPLTQTASKCRINGTALYRRGRRTLFSPSGEISVITAAERWKTTKIKHCIKLCKKKTSKQHSRTYLHVGNQDLCRTRQNWMCVCVTGSGVTV